MNKKILLIICLSTRMFGYMEILSPEEHERMITSPDRLFNLFAQRGLFNGEKKIKPARSAHYHLEKLFASPDEIARGLQSADIRTTNGFCPTGGADLQLAAPLITIAALCRNVEWIEKILARSEDKTPLANSAQFSPLVAALNGFNFGAVMNLFTKGYRKPDATSNKINTWGMPANVFVKALELGFEPEHFDLRGTTNTLQGLVLNDDVVAYNSEIIKRYPDKVMLPSNFNISSIDDFPNKEIFELSRFSPILEYREALKSSDMKALYEADLRIRTSNTGINLFPFVDIFMDYLKLRNVYEIAEAVKGMEAFAPSVNKDLLEKLDNCEDEFILHVLEAFLQYQDKKEYQLPIIDLFCQRNLPVNDLEPRFTSLRKSISEVRNKMEAGDWVGIKGIFAEYVKDHELEILLCGLFLSKYKNAQQEVYDKKLEELKPCLGESLRNTLGNFKTRDA